MQATAATVRSNTPMALVRISAARPVREKSFRCCTASQGLVPPHLLREAIIRVIRWLPEDSWLCFGSSSDLRSASPSPGGGVDVYRNQSQQAQQGGSLMNISKSIRAVAVSVLGFVLLISPVAAEQPTKIDFSNETVGAEPKSLVAVVGIWRIENDGGKNVLAVDGRQWKEGQSSAGVADKARALYGERYAEFLDRVQAYAYYPYTVAKDVENFRGGEITVRFEGLSGRIDQGAGILFNLKPNGDYLALRANCLENNLVLLKFEKGKPSSVSWVRNAPCASNQWHDLKVRITATKPEGNLDGKLYLEPTLSEPVSGRVV